MVVLNACIQKYIINIKIQQIVSILKKRQKDNKQRLENLSLIQAYYRLSLLLGFTKILEAVK